MATILPIGIGNVPNDGLGDYVRVAFDKCNQNFNALNTTPTPISATVITQIVKAGVGMSIGQPVYVSSANGTNVIVSLSAYNTELTSSKTLGLIAQNLALNGIGNVVTEGLLGGLNTGSAVAGDAVWLGPSGTLIYGIANKPSAPNHLVFIGIVTRANNSNGEIYVKVQNGFELEELHNVAISNPTINQALCWDNATSLWKNFDIIKNIAKGTPMTIVANNNQHTMIYAIPLPANSFTSTDKFNIQSMMFSKTGNGLNATYRVYLSTVPAISGYQILEYQPAIQDSKYVNLIRNFSIYNNYLYGWPYYDSAPTGTGGSPNLISATPFNPSQSYYLVVTVDMTTVVESIQFLSYQITN